MKHSKNIISIFLTMKATILDTHGRHTGFLAVNMIKNTFCGVKKALIHCLNAFFNT
jgi:hypothetical protein